MMQDIFIYPGASQELNFVLKRLNKRKIFLVTGKKSYCESGAMEIINNILRDFEVYQFSDFNTNPDWEDVKKGIKFFKQMNAGILVAVGGGSVIDMAKLINYFYNVECNSRAFNSIENSDFLPVPYICMPTTAGSGSEATHFAVMYIGDDKFSVAHQNLSPNYVIIDPEFHYSQTPYQKAVSGVDALSQSIESLWSVQSTEESRIYAERALKIIWENLPKVVNDGDELAHLRMAIGANLAGRAINISKTTAPHAFSYGITKKFGLPHGHALALLLPKIIKATITNFNVDTPNFYLDRIGDILNCPVHKISETIDSFFDSINLLTNIDKLKINKKQLISSFESMNIERLKNHPVLITAEMIAELF